jgi:hypothetical protein
LLERKNMSKENMYESLPSRATIEAAKPWSPESPDFWNLGVRNTEADHALEADRISLEFLNKGRWEPDEFEKTVKDYAQERNLEESVSTEASCILAVDTNEKGEGILKDILPNFRAQLLAESRDRLKAKHDHEMVWRSLKLMNEVEKKINLLNKETA